MDKNLIDLLVAISVVIISSLLIILVIVLLNKESDDNKDVIDLQRSMLDSGNGSSTMIPDVVDFTIPIIVLSFVCIILLSSFIFFSYKAIKLISFPSLSLPTSLTSVVAKPTTDDVTTLTLTDSYESMF